MSVRTCAGYHIPACSVLGTFRLDYLYSDKLSYILQTFCERHGQFEFLQVIILIKPQNMCSLITLASYRNFGAGSTKFSCHMSKLPEKLWPHVHPDVRVDATTLVCL